MNDFAIERLKQQMIRMNAAHAVGECRCFIDSPELSRDSASSQLFTCLLSDDRHTYHRKAQLFAAAVDTSDNISLYIYIDYIHMYTCIHVICEYIYI